LFSLWRDTNSLVRREIQKVESFCLNKLIFVRAIVCPPPPLPPSQPLSPHADASRNPVVLLKIVAYLLLVTRSVIEFQEGLQSSPNCTQLSNKRLNYASKHGHSTPVSNPLSQFLLLRKLDILFHSSLNSEL
jgi:hypothetical protein